MKHINPVYSALNDFSHSDAVRIYNGHKSFYHPIAAEGIERRLGLSSPPADSKQQDQIRRRTFL